MKILLKEVRCEKNFLIFLVIICVCSLGGMFYFMYNNGNPDANMNAAPGDSESEDAGINENDEFQFNKIEILDVNDKLITEDGGWYIVSGGIKLQICYKGVPEAVSVFYMPTGTQMLSKRKQLAVYSLYEDGAEGIEFKSSDKEVEGEEIVINVLLEEISGTGHIYVMLENEDKGIFSERYNISIEQ